MTHIDLGVTGAKRQSWRESNPRALLIRLLEKYPHAGDEELFDRFQALARGDEAMRETIERYWFENNVRSLRLPLGRPSSPGAAYRRQTAAASRETLQRGIHANVKQHIADEAERLLLELIMPNGKPLRDCTGVDCASIGGWLTALAAKLKPGETVGEKFTEDQVRSFWRIKAPSA